MSIQARIKLLWGALGLIVSSLLLSWAYGTVAMNSQQPGPLAVSSNEPAYGHLIRSNLEKLYEALSQYAMVNGDEYPPRLSMLYPTYISDPAVFWNPGDSDPCPTTIDNDEPNGRNSTQVSFSYTARTPVIFEGTILQDNSLSYNQGAGVYALTSFIGPTFFKTAAVPPSWTQVPRANLKQLGLALASYANDNNGYYPDRLSRLYPAYVADPAVFWNPGDDGWYYPPCPTTIDNDNRKWSNSAQISFDYLGAGRTINSEPGAILLQDNSPANDGGAVINLLTADLNVTTYIRDVSCGSPPECRAGDRARLRAIATDMLTYAQANNGSLPTRLSMLYNSYYIADPTVFWSRGDSDPCPLFIDNDVPNQTNSAQISYAYFTGTNTRVDAVMLHDSTLTHNAGQGLHVASVDGAVDFFERSERMLATTATARVHLQAIGQGLQAYAAANSGHFPDQLSLLYPTYVSDPAAFWHPGDAGTPCPPAIAGDTPDRPGSAQMSFNYLGAGYSTGCDPGVVLVADNSRGNNAGVGVLVLTADGHADYFVPSSLSCRYPSTCTSVARGNLRQIYSALCGYAFDSRDWLPAKLSMLYRKNRTSYPWMSRSTTFWHPGDSDMYPLTIDNDGLNQPDSAQISFEFVGAGKRTYTLGPDDILVRDNTPANNNGNGTLVLYADGDVAFVPIRSVTSIAVSGPASVSESSTAHYTCTATYDDGTTRDVTSEAGWNAEWTGYFQDPGNYLAPSLTADKPCTLRVSYVDEANRAFEVQKAITVQNTVRGLTGLAISSGPIVVAEGNTGSYTCIATYDDGGTEDVTAQATWSVASGPGSFSSAGTYVAPAAVFVDTPATIRAAFSCPGGSKEATRDITIQNNKRVLTNLTITSGPVSVAEGGSADYTCTATYDDGGTEDVTALASWSVAGGPGAFSGAGMYAAPGTVLADTPVTIKVSYSRDGATREATKNITVQNTLRVLTGVAISAGPTNVNEGATASYVCTATYDDSTTENVTASALWSVASGPGSFSVAGSYAAPATVLANVPVTLLVTCTKAGVTKQATKNITVLNSVRKLSSLSISSGPASVAEGGNGSYTCTATYDDSTTQNVTSGAVWSVTSGPGSFPSAGAYAAPASVTNNTAVTIQASYAEAGISKQATKDIVVVNGIRKLSSIAITGPASVSEGANASYTCTATYDDATTQDVTTSATWYLMASPGSFLVPGTYAAPPSVLADTAVVIYVSYVEGGITQQANKSITVLNSVRKLTSVEITSGPTEVAEAGSADYVCTATYDDDSLEEVTSQATWSVTSGVGVFSAKGKFAAPVSVLADTPTTLSVSFGQGVVFMQASLNITVKNTIRRLASVAIASGPGAVTAGATGQYTCTAKYDDNTTQDATNGATWSVASGPGSFSAAGVYAAPASVVGAVTVTIKAKLVEAGVTKEVTKTIRVEPAPIADADGDGVADGADACPGTPAGTAVDASGCAASQRDSDSDGVSDDRDQCPGTPSGTAVQANGCASSSVSDRDHDGVADDVDGCPDDAGKTAPGACGCGVPETPGCGTTPTYTVRVIAAEGASSPYTYPAGTWAEIAAPAAPEGMRFSHWSGAYNGTDAIARVYVDGDKQLVANYEECPEQGPAPCGAGTPAACGVVGVVLAMMLRTRIRDKGFSSK